MARFAELTCREYRLFEYFGHPDAERVVVLMGSGAGLGGQPRNAVYSGVKGFVLNLAESIWAELRDAGIDVIAIAAPVMETPAMRASLGVVSSMARKYA